ncbi:MAG TPA: hypothetical protein VGM03_18540 [Phycisphaerae bacterium]
MRVICASCRVEGRSGDLGEKAPFDDPTETHGYCARHAAQLLASLPSLSFPDVEMLLVVRRHDPILFEYLQRRLVGVRGVKVILERRQGDRRREARPPVKDRRRLQRRLRHGQMSSLGYTSVRFRVIPSGGTLNHAAAQVEAASRGRLMGRPRQAQLLPVWDDDGVPQPRLQRPNSRLRRRTAVLS